MYFKNIVFVFYLMKHYFHVYDHVTCLMLKRDDTVTFM